jgi:hypothetical protein
MGKRSDAGTKKDQWAAAREDLLHALYHIRDHECEVAHGDTEFCPRRAAKEAIDGRPCSACAQSSRSSGVATTGRKSGEQGGEHVDDFIESPLSDAYAAFVLNHFRLPALMKMRFDPFFGDRKLFCDFEGRRYRVTGASRLGDVWLARDHSQDVGYDHRVDVGCCTKWGPSP